MSRPKLLDLFCGAQGAGVGYHRAGFDVTGVDIEAHPDAPLPIVVAWGGVYVIENVPGARRELHNPITLSGGAFGLRVERPRLFESNVPLTAPRRVKVIDPLGVYGRSPDGRRLFTRKDGSIQRAARGVDEGRAAMGIDWMEWHDLTEAIPPAYTEHIGRQLLAHIESERAA